MKEVKSPSTESSTSKVPYDIFLLLLLLLFELQLFPSQAHFLWGFTGKQRKVDSSQLCHVL